MSTAATNQVSLQGLAGLNSSQESESLKKESQYSLVDTKQLIQYFEQCYGDRLEKNLAIEEMEKTNRIYRQ